MYEQVEKPKEDKSRTVAASVNQKKSNRKQGFGFVDNRPEAVVQRKLQTTTFDSTDTNIKNRNVHSFATSPPVMQLQVNMNEARLIYAHLNKKLPNVSEFALFSYFQNLINDPEMTYDKAIALINNVKVEGDEGGLEETIPLTKGKFVKAFWDKVGRRGETRRVATVLEGTWKLSGNQVDENPTPYKGYSFVTMADGIIRVWPIIGDKDTFHRGLADFAKEVRFAGEVIFDEEGNVIAWNNKSGNYKPESNNAKYAGLPMDKFEKHVGKTQGGKESRHLQTIQ